MVISKFLLVNPAKSATGESAFAITCLRVNMNQEKFNHVAILQANKTSKDKIKPVEEANEVA